MKLRYLFACAALAGAGTLGAVWLVGESRHTENKVVLAALAATTTLSFVFSGLVALWRRPRNPTGFLLVATGFLWLLGALTTANEPWLFTLGWIVNGAAWGAFAHLILAFPSGRLESRFHRILVAAVWAVVIVPAVGLLLVNGTGSVSPVCGAGCPDSTIAVWDSRDAARAILTASSLGALAVIAASLVALVGRWRRASPPLRRALGPVFFASGLTLVLLVVALIVQETSGDAARPIEFMALAAFAAVPIAFLAGVLRSRLARWGVGDLLLSLGRGTPIRDALAEELRDPTLQVAYWRPELGRYVLPDGEPLPEPTESRQVTYVAHDGRPTAALVHDASLADERELVEAVTAAAELWLTNERLQTELRGQFELLDTIVNAAPSLLCLLDLEGRITNLNEASHRASGLPEKEDLRGQVFWDVFVRPEERDEARRRFHEELAPDHETHSFEQTFVTPAGDERTIAWSTAPIFNQRGVLTNLVAGGLDITERQQRERELRSSEERLRAAIDASPVAIVEYALDDTIVRWNPAAERIFGWTAEEVLGGPAKHQPPGREQEIAGLFRRVRDGEVYRAVESVRFRKGGAPIDVEISAAPIRDAAGNVLSHMALFADITQRKQQEEELRASRARIVQAADDARRVLERNLHDGAQQRLVALSLSLRLAQSKVSSAPAEAEAVLEAARAELAAALDDLRELARGIHPAVLTDRGLAAAVEALANRSPVPVEFAPADVELAAPVEAAAYYVVAESLANVIKYAEAAQVRVRIASEDGNAVVEVSDDGVGGADPAVGSGLRGLADRVEALGGSLTVRSPAGEGTCVTAVIPLSPARRG